MCTFNTPLNILTFKCVLAGFSHFPPKILEIGPCAKNCGSFNTAEDTHEQPWNFLQRRTQPSVEFQGSWTLEFFGGIRWHSILEIVALKDPSLTLRNTHRHTAWGRLCVFFLVIHFFRTTYLFMLVTMRPPCCSSGSNCKHQTMWFVSTSPKEPTSDSVRGSCSVVISCDLLHAVSLNGY